MKLKIQKFIFHFMMKTVVASFQGKKEKIFSFTCSFCETFNEINFEEICNNDTVQLLKSIMKKNLHKVFFTSIYFKNSL